MIGEHHTSVILQATEFSIATLFASDHAVAICSTEGERLKNLILLVREADWGVVVVQTVAGETYLIARAASVHQGNLVGDIRKWDRDEGYQFVLKRSHEQLSGPRENVFVLPDGRIIEVQRVLAQAGNLTHWGLHDKSVPAGYARF